MKFSFLIKIIFFLFFRQSILFAIDPKPKQAPSGLYGYADEKGNFIITPKYDKAFSFENGSALVLEKKLWGLIDLKGNYKISAKYHEMYAPKGNTIVVGVKNEKSSKVSFGLLDISGKELIKLQYSYITPDYNNQIFIVGNEIKEKDAKTKIRFGIVNYKNVLLIPIQFKEIKHTRYRVFAAKSENEQWQLYDVDGKPVFGNSYLDINEFDELSAVVETEKGYTIIDRSGKKMFEGDYRKIIKKNATTFELLAFPHIKVTDSKHTILFSTQYASIQASDEKLYIFGKDDKYGLLNEKGEVLIENRYDFISNFKNGIAIVKANGLSGVINQKLQTIVQPLYEKIEIDSINSLIKAFINNKWLVFNKFGKQITSLKYDEIIIQQYAMMFARQSEIWYLLGSDGKIVGTNSFNKVSNFQNLHAVATWKNGTGLVDTKGNWVLEPVFDSIKIISSHLVITYSKGIYNIINIFNKKIQFAVEQFELLHQNYLIITVGGKKGLINYRGQEVLHAAFDFISDFTKDSIITISKEKKFGLIGLKGNVILKPVQSCEEMGIMQEERVAVKIKNKYGFYDANGGLRIANRYEAVQDFSCGLVAIKLKGKWGFINKAEEIVIQPQFDKVENFRNNLVLVQKNKKWGIYNSTGQELLKPQFDNIYPISNGKYISENAGKKGIIGKNGNEIIPVGYDILQETPDKNFIAKKNNKYGLITSDGLDAIPLMYDKMWINGKNYIISIEGPPKSFELKQY